MSIQDEVLQTAPHWEEVLSKGNIELNARDYVSLAFGIRQGDVSFASLAAAEIHPQVAQSPWGTISVNREVPVGMVRTTAGDLPLPWRA